MAPVLHHLGGEGPVVVLIHGFGADRLGWVATAPALFDSHSVWATELPAHGASEPGAVTPREMAQALLAALPPSAWPMALIGHSLGGAIAALLAGLAPDRIGKTILLAPAGFGRGLSASTFLTRFPQLESEDEALALLRTLVVRERLILPQMAQHVLAHLAMPGRREALARIGQAVMAFDTPALPKDALVVWGEQDAINPPETDWLSSLGDRALVLPDTGHLPHVEAASRVNRRIAEYFAA